MSMWFWIALAVGIVVVVLLALFAVKGSRDRRIEKQRAEALELREEAERRFAEAGKREALAEREAHRARSEREAAVQAARRADDVDPDVET